MCENSILTLWNGLGSEPKMCHKSFLDKKFRGAVRVRVLIGSQTGTLQTGTLQTGTLRIREKCLEGHHKGREVQEKGWTPLTKTGDLPIL